MDQYIYQADVYCEDCARDIKRRIRAQGPLDFDPRDQSSYDSDQYPKGPFSDEVSDVPEHCACGPDCLNAHVWSDGSKAGAFLENPLTLEGERYVREMHRESNSEVTRFWIDYYDLDSDNDE